MSISDNTNPLSAFILTLSALANCSLSKPKQEATSTLTKFLNEGATLLNKSRIISLCLSVTSSRLSLARPVAFSSNNMLSATPLDAQRASSDSFSKSL